MSKALSSEEKRIRQTKRDEKRIEKLLTPKLDERCYEILRILRDAPNHPEIKYNSKYFENHFQKIFPEYYTYYIKYLKDFE